MSVPKREGQDLRVMLHGRGVNSSGTGGRHTLRKTCWSVASCFAVRSPKQRTTVHVSRGVGFTPKIGHPRDQSSSVLTATRGLDLTGV